MQIQFLWWEGCPSHPEAWQRLHHVLAELCLNIPVESIKVTTDAQAEHWCFRGSPTILVNGKDIDPSAERQPARLTCRLYFKDDGRPSPLPPESMIRRALVQTLATEERTRNA